MLLSACSIPIQDDMLPSFSMLLSKLEIAIQVDKKLFLAPSLLPESIDYPPPVYVGLSKKAFLVDRDIYNAKESPGDWLKSVSEHSVKLNEETISTKKSSVESVFTNLELPIENSSSRSARSKGDDYLEITEIDATSFTDSNTYTNSYSVSSTSSYPKFDIVRSYDSSSPMYQHLAEPLYEGIRNPEINVAYHPPLFRFWLAHFIPEGFWPRLLCRIVSDLEIDATFTQLFPSTLRNREVGESHSLNRTDIEGCFLWNLWKTGLVFVHEGVTLVELKQSINEKITYDKMTANSRLFSEKYRIEVIVHISSLAVVHYHDCQHCPLPNKEIIKLGTKLLVLIEQHVIDIGEEWYHNTLGKTEGESVSSYAVCSECLADKPNIYNPNYTPFYFMSLNGEVVFCFAFEDILKSFVEYKPLKCPCHEEIPIQLLVPDLVSSNAYVCVCVCACVHVCACVCTYLL